MTPNDDFDDDEEMKEMSMEDLDYMEDEEIEEELVNRSMADDDYSPIHKGTSG